PAVAVEANGGILFPVRHGEGGSVRQLGEEARKQLRSDGASLRSGVDRELDDDESVREPTLRKWLRQLRRDGVVPPLARARGVTVDEPSGRTILLCHQQAPRLAFGFVA